MKKEIKSNSVSVRITAEENKMIKALRDNYCVNISKLIRKFIRDTYEKNEKKE
jgi:hypothetical protein